MLITATLLSPSGRAYVMGRRLITALIVVLFVGLAVLVLRSGYSSAQPSVPRHRISPGPTYAPSNVSNEPIRVVPGGSTTDSQPNCEQVGASLGNRHGKPRCDRVC